MVVSSRDIRLAGKIILILATMQSKMTKFNTVCLGKFATVLEDLKYVTI